MFRSEDLPYWGALFLIGTVLGILAGFGFEWPPLLVAAAALYLAVFVIWWQRHGRHR
jgi:hypothetical protein